MVITIYEDLSFLIRNKHKQVSHPYIIKYYQADLSIINGVTFKPNR